MTFPEALLTFRLHLNEMKDKLEHPRWLAFETTKARFEPEFKLSRSKVSLTWTITFGRRHKLEPR